MLLEILSDYLAEIDAALSSLTKCHFEKYEEEILTSNRINLRIRIRFAKGHLFELNEAIIVEHKNLMHLSYRYHFQDKENHLIFRYDNVPHFPHLSTYPHHKHLLNDVIPADKPAIEDIVKEIAKVVSSKSTKS